MIPKQRINFQKLALWLGFSGVLGLASLAPALADPMTIGHFQWMDKVTTRIYDFKLKVGEKRRIGPLRIALYHCDRAPPTEPPESTAFIKIEELRSDDQVITLLSGWIFASSPAIHSLEHAVYDVWLVECEGGIETVPNANNSTTTTNP